MTDYEFGDVVLVPFPFMDLKTSKRRPALVLTSFQPSSLPPYSMIAMITSQVESESLAGDYLLKEWRQTNLIYPSKVRLSKVVSVENDLFIKRVGQLQPVDQEGCSQAFYSLFDF